MPGRPSHGGGPILVRRLGIWEWSKEDGLGHDGPAPRHRGALNWKPRAEVSHYPRPDASLPNSACHGGAAHRRQ